MRKKENRKNRYRLNDDDVLVGTYRRNSKGFGFVKTDEFEEEVFVSKDDSNNALNGKPFNDSISDVVKAVAEPLKGLGVLSTSENNTVIIDGDISKQHIINCEDSVVSYNHSYRNNIFMSTKENAPIFANGTIDKPLFEGNLYFNVVSGNPLLNQLVLEDDPRAVINVNPKIKIPTTIDGFEQIYVFEPEGSLMSYATALKRQLKYDLKGKDTTNISYLGAIAK